MSEFKPMVKMYTDEPSVSLKLKKGGAVKHHGHHKGKHHEEHGHKAMHHAAGGHMHGAHHAFESEHGKAPKKPSITERHHAMNPNFKKGGKVAHKLDGGLMGAASAMGAGANPIGINPITAAAIAKMAPAARAARAAMVRRALTGMKKGGSADHSLVQKLEKELHHHEAMPAAKAHGKHHKASGGAIDKDETRTTIEGGANKFARTKIDKSHHDSRHGTGEVKENVPGGYRHGGRAHHGHHESHHAHGGHAKHHAHGGKVHHISGHPEGSHEHHKHMAKHHAHKHAEGGSAHHKKMHEHHKHMAKMCKGGSYASGGSIPSGSHNVPNKAKTAMGGTYEGNERDYENTEMHTAVADKARGTGGVAMSNAGGFRHGGKAHHAHGGHHKVHHKASGGKIEHEMVRNTVEGGNWENRAANTAKPGKSHTKTGEVHESNAGGYRHGGHASKKVYATGGNVVDDGRPEKMPRRIVHPPVANSLQSGTYRRGGKVKRFAGGGDMDDSSYENLPNDVRERLRPYDANEAYHNWERLREKENLEDSEMIPNALRRAADSIKGLFSSSTPSRGSVTRTEKSVTVSPGKKRGGKC